MLYHRHDENSRLTKDKSHRVEFLTTVKYIEKYLNPGAKFRISVQVSENSREYPLCQFSGQFV